jgi:UDP-2,3-diacylglucosamine hydrolase
MKFSVISDVHVKSPGDNAEKLLLTFLRNPEVRNSDIIYLLGDIFDLMIGPHSQYFKRFQEVFTEIKKLLEAGVTICYVEGNHDFHLRKLFDTFFSVNGHINKDLFQLKSSFEQIDGGKKIYLAHGDDIELGNLNYKIFKATVTSTPLKYFANFLMPYFLIKSIGEYSSELSRKRNNKRYTTEANLEPVKVNFRNSVDYFNKQNAFQVIVLGHSHVKDHYVSNLGFEYVNNGYAQHSKTYISIENGHVSFKNIFD